ncbi:MAG TPA: hypothetical protein VMV69_12480 [Pirellulales bacterium]|nr:hypothetical protein [Pirellulales bacterium]
MKFALSALCAIIMLAGGTGCHPCCHRHSILDRDCTAGGCGPRVRFRPYQYCDTCDQCGNWTGAPIVSRSRSYQGGGYAEDYGHISRSENESPAHGYRVVPGSQRVTTRSGQPTLARASGRPTSAMMADESVDEVDDEIQVAPARIKSKRVSRVRTMRPRPLQEE